MFTREWSTARRSAHSARSAGPSPVPSLICGLACALVLAGCGSDLPEPGPDAKAAACTALIARLPARVLDRPRVELAVTGAAAWGDPAIVLRCGVTPSGPTTDPCTTVNGVDWTFSETKDAFRFRTYGRSPAVEVTVPTTIDRTTAPGAQVDLADAVRPLPATAHCIG